MSNYLKILLMFLFLMPLISNAQIFWTENFTNGGTG